MRKLESISHLIPRAERCGIYVLGFTDGERYVGQSVDVLTRYVAHRRRWADISTLDWHACDQTLLDLRELAVINGHHAAGLPIRNIKHARGPLGPSPLDTYVTPDEQLAWINGDDPFSGTPARQRRVHEEQRLSQRPAFQKLEKDSHFPAVALALNVFVQRTIPQPEATERLFWVLTAMPSTNRSKGHYRLATLSINKVEVFWLFSTEFEGAQIVWGNVQLSRSMLTQRLGTTDFDSALGPDLSMSVDFEAAGYETSGGDGLRVRFVGDAWLELLRNEAVIEAARSFNLMLLRKGRSPLGHHHNYDLADWALHQDLLEVLDLE